MPRNDTLIVYHSTKSAFLDAAFTRDIESVILAALRTRVGQGVSRQEVRYWKESLLAMAKVLNDDAIPGDCGVAVEYGIPQTSKRIDLLRSGRDEAGRANLRIVELKQWEHAKRTPMDGVVRTRFAHGEADTSHPSYQSWSYAELLWNFNAAVNEADVPLQPCAHLHNCDDDADQITRPEMLSRQDAEGGSGRGAEKADAIVRNTYGTLMTRGMKGAFVYCVDEEIAEYFRCWVRADATRTDLRQVAEGRGPYNCT